jgi:PAS domain S-box-containing protein
MNTMNRSVQDDVSVRPGVSCLINSVFENIKEGALILDARGCILKINQHGIIMHGFNESETKQLHHNPLQYHQVFDADHIELPVPQWPQNRLLTGEHFTDVKFIIVPHPNTLKMLVSCTGIPSYNEKGEFFGGVLIYNRYSESEDFNSLLLNRDEYFKNLVTYQQKLNDERELLQSVINNIPVMVTIYDKNVHSIILNDAFVKITGWTNEDVKHKNIMELAYPDPSYRNEVYYFMASLHQGFRDIVMRTKNGKDIETSWANIEISDGRQVGVGIDISERVKLENDLIAAREKAEKEARFQYDFIQNISHEVRTPMNSILGFTELLHNGIYGIKEKKFLNAISNNGEQLLRLIDDIIILSQLDNDDIKIQKEKTGITEVMEQIRLKIEGLRKRYNKNKINLAIICPDSDKHAIIETDTVRLQQVLLNLVDNALKYTVKGSVEIGCRFRQEQNDILFYVRDTGLGIKKDFFDKIFKRFYRYHDHSTNEFRGTGLGLPISKQLVKLLGGDMWFESEYGKGSVFYFSHPYLEMVENIPYPSVIRKVYQNDDVMPDLSKHTILIVEDDSFSYLMLYHMLEETNAMVIHADTGPKAVQIFERYHADLVFLDIRLPEMDGYQVIEALKKINSRIPVVAQTANALPDDQRKIKAAGFSDLITKPLSRSYLNKILRKFLQPVVL